MKTEDKKEKLARYEFKYLLDSVTYMKVKEFVESIGLSQDKNAPSNPYPVTSLYFDSFGLDDYYDKAGGFIDRKKVRIRVYADKFDSNLKDIHFEVKNKYDMFVSKDRAIVSGKEWDKIMKGDFARLSKEFDYHIFKDGRAPIVIVRYKREAFDSWFYGRVRLTFDREIEALRPDLLAKADDMWYDSIPVSSSSVVLEIKFADRLPWWFRAMMEEFDLQRTAYSKYARAVDAIYRYDPLPR